MSMINPASAVPGSVANAPPIRKGALFITLLGLGLLGVLSLYFMPVAPLLAEATDLPDSALRLIVLIQPAVLTVLAVTIGVFTAGSVGLRAPVIEAWLNRHNGWAQLKPGLFPAVISGILVALAILVFGILQIRLMPELATQEAAAFPLISRVFLRRDY